VTASRRGRLAASVVGAALVLAGSAFGAAAEDTTMVPLRDDLASRTFAAGCNSCHYRGGERAAFGRRSPLGESSPDEAAQYILFGKAPESDEGGMPAFGKGLSDADIARLLVWMRETAVPGKPWSDVTASVTRMRSTGTRED
jgi:mono/diheme cytochrome c family protein